MEGELIMKLKEERPPIKAYIKRAIRKEAYYGCAICGNPIIEYHHIEPYHKVLCHEAANLIALCPTDHNKADIGMIPKEQLYALKKKPFNSLPENQDIRDKMFFGNYDNLEFKAGGSSFIRTSNLFVIDDLPLISVKRDKLNNAVINAKFFDKSSNLLAEIHENEWITYFEEEEIWDVQYTGGKLKINSGKRTIFLELDIKPESNYVEVRANLYHKGFYFNIKPSGIIYGFNLFEKPKSVNGGSIRNSTFTDCRNGIVLSSSNL